MAPVPCDIARVSGATVQTSYHGFYEATGTCDSKPSYECLDCSGSGRKIWHHPYGYWMIGADGCDSTSAAAIYIISDEDLADVSGDWTEAGGGENSAITVECYAAAGCQHVPGTTAKYRCFDCGGASALASVGDGHCDAENNVDPCYDGGDCCETTCVDGSPRDETPTARTPTRPRGRTRTTRTPRGTSRRSARPRRGPRATRAPASRSSSTTTASTTRTRIWRSSTWPTRAACMRRAREVTAYLILTGQTVRRSRPPTRTRPAASARRAGRRHRVVRQKL